MKKIKILFVLQNLIGGGAEKVTLNVIRNIDRNRFIPSLFLMEKQGVYFSDIPEDVKVIYGSEVRPYNKYLLPYYIAILAKASLSCDLIVGAMEVRPTYAASRLSKKPAIGWVHIKLDSALQGRNKIHTILSKYIYNNIDATVCVSEDNAAVIKQIFRNCKKVLTINNIHEIDKIQASSKEVSPQWFVNLLREKPVVISMGRLQFQKGYDLLINSHAEAVKSGLNYHLVIIGDGEQKERLLELAKTFDVFDTVHFPGYIKNPYPLLRESTAYVLSSRYEGLPGVLVEALSLGIPIVSTKCSGAGEVLQDGEFGLMVEHDNVSALSQGIRTILTNSDLRKELRLKGPKRAAFFRAENIMLQWEKLITEVCRV